MANPRPEVDWNSVWKWQGPGRVQYFLWLVAQGKLLTNLERKRRHLTEDSSCPRCGATKESILHVLRDCNYAGQVWECLGIDYVNVIQRGANTNDWLSGILRHVDSRQLIIACWYLWKVRNEWIFSGTESTAASTARRIQVWNFVVSSAIDHQYLITKATPVRTRADGGKAAVGGLIRNSEGRCLHAFCTNLGKCSIMRAELRGIIIGLQIAWENGFRKVDARVDYQAILTLIKDNESATHQHVVDIAVLRELLEREWDVTISHIYREGNFAADYLANLGHDYPWGVHLISLSDCNLSYFLRRDCIGISEPRFIPVN
ncbi:Putative ribonuclease H protein At1g65750 [Linum perenne]